MIEATDGSLADNASLLFNPAGDEIVLSSGSTARRWAIRTGKETGAWSLPPGWVDVMGYDQSARLLLFRAEMLDGNLAPPGKPPRNPRVCRIRELLDNGESKLLAEIRDFNWHVFNADAPADVPWFLVQGVTGNAQSRTVSFKAFDSLTGRELWSVPTALSNRPSGLALDAQGRFIAWQTNLETSVVLVDALTGVPTKSLPWTPAAMSPEGRLYAARGLPGMPNRGVSLFDSEALDAPLVTLGVDSAMSFYPYFDHTGNRLAWGNLDGSVTVCDLQEVNRRLATLGLQWKTSTTAAP